MWYFEIVVLCIQKKQLSIQFLDGIYRKRMVPCYRALI